MAIGQSRIVSVVSNTEPITLAEAKNYLRVTNAQDDAKITSQITAARNIAEGYLNRDILPREREQFIFQDETMDGIIELYGTPINSSESITVEIDGESSTEDDGWEKIGLEYDQNIRVLSSYNKNIKITYETAGLVDNASVKQGVLAILRELYEYGEVKNKWIWTILSPIKKTFL